MEMRFLAKFLNELLQFMEEKHVNFKCSMCGMCCRNIHYWKKNLHLIRKLLNDNTIDFPYKDVNGVCEMLSDNKCSIYESRPIVCNTEKMYKLLHQVTGMEVSEFLKYQTISCTKNRLGLRE